MFVYLFIIYDLVKFFEGKWIKFYQFIEEIKVILENFFGFQFIICDVINKVLQEKRRIQVKKKICSELVQDVIYFKKRNIIK